MRTLARLQPAAILDRPPVREADAGRWFSPSRLKAAWLIWAGLFGAGVLLRLQNLDNGPYGDEAYYYFVTHNLGAYWQTATYPVSGSVFPVFPLLLHFGAASLASLRVVNVIVGAMAIPIVMAILRSLRVRPVLQWVAGAMVACDLILVQFSSLAFLDMLGATIALVAIWAYVSGRYELAAAVTAVAVLEKEYYALLGLAFFVDYLITRRRIYWGMGLAGIVVCGWVVLRYGVWHASFQYLLHSHAHAPLQLTGVTKALGSAFLIPLIVVGAISGRLRPAAYFVAGFIGFQWLWGNAEGWYWCLPALASILLAAYGADVLLDRARQLGWPRQALVALVSVIFAASLGLGIWQTRAYVTTWHDHSVLSIAAYLDAHADLRSLGVAHCFWGYAYYPLGDNGRQVKVVGDWSVDSPNVVLACPGAARPASGWQPVLTRGGYSLLVRQGP